MRHDVIVRREGLGYVADCVCGWHTNTGDELSMFRVVNAHYHGNYRLES